MVRVGCLAGVVVGAAAAQAPVTAVVSLDSNEQPAATHSRGPSVAADVRYIAFSTTAPLVATDTNNVEDVYLRDMLTGETLRVSLKSNGQEVLQACLNPSVSDDGRFIVFQSAAPGFTTDNDPDTNGAFDVILRDRDPDGDGNFDETGEDTSVTPPVNQAPTAAIVSRSNGQNRIGNGASYDPVISGDGFSIVFTSEATNLTADLVSTAPDIFVRERDPDGNGAVEPMTSKTVLLSLDSAGEQGLFLEHAPSVSSSGRYVAFQTASTLAPEDTNGTIYDVYVRDRDTDGDNVLDEPGTSATELVSMDDLGQVGDAGSLAPSISRDGRYVVFESNAANLTDDAQGPGGPAVNVYLHDRQADTTILVSRGAGGVTGDGHSRRPVISAGRFVAFESEATNIVAGLEEGERHVYVLDRDADGDGILDEPGQTSFDRASSSSAGVPGSDESFEPTLSPEGGHVVFVSRATNLVDGDLNGADDVFIHGSPVLAMEPSGVFDLGGGSSGFAGVPQLTAIGSLVAPEDVTLLLSEARPFAPCLLVIGVTRIDLPKAGGLLVPAPDLLCFLFVGGDKKIVLSTAWPALPPGFEFYVQYWIEDIEGPGGSTLSNAILLRSA